MKTPIIILNLLQAAMLVSLFMRYSELNEKYKNSLTKYEQLLIEDNETLTKYRDLLIQNNSALTLLTNRENLDDIISSGKGRWVSLSSNYYTKWQSHTSIHPSVITFESPDHKLIVEASTNGAPYYKIFEYQMGTNN